MMNYEGMVEKIISLYSYCPDRIWNIGVLSRSIPDCDSLNLVEYDDYGSRI